MRNMRKQFVSVWRDSCYQCGTNTYGSALRTSTYRLGSVVVTDTLTVKDETNAVLGLAHPLCVGLLELGELGGALDLEEDLVSFGVLDLDVELLGALGLGLRSFCVRHVV